MQRGILATIYCVPKKTEDEIDAIYQKYYKNEPFVEYFGTKRLPELKFTNYTNNFMTGFKVDKRTGRMIIVSTLDNLIKGASGQAVQNMNIMFGFKETAGLI